MLFYCLHTDMYEWCRPNKETSESGYLMILVNASMCAPWVAWIAANGVVHFVWVGTLLGCQLYQVCKSLLTDTVVSFSCFHFFFFWYLAVLGSFINYFFLLP